MLENTSFIHFNDVYNVEKAPPFVASIKKTKRLLEESNRHVFTFFSGDAFSPSGMSTILRGEQMIPVINAMGIDAACLGNHDLDFGLNEFKELKDQCNFPWICSNAFENDETPLGECHEYLILDKGDGSPKILVLGIVETGWLDTLATIDPEDIIFEDPVQYVKRRVSELEKEFGPFDAIVATSHMRMPMDYKLAESGVVDIILGGHDHHYEDTVVNNIRVLNSSTDFKSFTVIDVNGRTESGVLDTTSRRVDITADDVPDPELAEVIKGFEEMANQGIDVVVGRTKVRLDANFSEIRTKETNCGNFLAEVIAR
jgi:5'-nucleotidase